DLIGFGSVMRGVLPKEYNPSLPAALDQWLFVKTTQTWFPRYGSPPQPADMDLTFHTPRRYHFASIGRLLETHTDGDVLTTHWVTERPTDGACFNLGGFGAVKMVPVWVQAHRDARRQLRTLL